MHGYGYCMQPPLYNDAKIFQPKGDQIGQVPLYAMLSPRALKELTCDKTSPQLIHADSSLHAVHACMKMVPTAISLLMILVTGVSSQSKQLWLNQCIICAWDDGQIDASIHGDMYSL